MGSKIHIGLIVKEVFENQPRYCTVSWLARQLHCGRANVYNIFERQSIDTDLLMRLSIILKHDFFKYFSAIIED